MAAHKQGNYDPRDAQWKVGRKLRTPCSSAPRTMTPL